MCLLAIYHRVVPRAPLIIGANREEHYDRGGEPPKIFDGPCKVVAGVDPLAGGTWLGVNQHGVAIAVTNRAKSEIPAQPRSRGLLVRDLLLSGSAASAGKHAIRELEQNAYAGCNILCADRDDVLVIHAGDWLRVRPLPPGIHVLTAHDVDDYADPRIAHSLSWLAMQANTSSSRAIDSLKQLCAQTGTAGPAIALHGTAGGTVSSTILALPDDLASSTLWHAQGAPDNTPYADMSGLMRELFSFNQR